MTEIIAEFKERLERDFRHGMSQFLPDFSAAARNGVKANGLGFSAECDGGAIGLRLLYSDKNRFHLVLQFTPTGAVEPQVRVDAFATRLSREELARGFWVEDRVLPSVRDIDDDFWIPTPPSPERFLNALIAAKGRREHLSYVIVDDDLVAEALVSGASSESVLMAVEEYLEGCENAWAEIASLRGVGEDDVTYAVGGKVEQLLGVLASRGLGEFRELVHR